jgi:predicted nucleic acid-binding protein
MRIYLDCCCLQRPYDDQTQPRIRVETEAVFAILTGVQSGDVTLLGSEALEYELSRIPDAARRHEAMALLSLAAERLVITEDIELLSDLLEQDGIAAMDAVHLAVASCSGADFFVTCDDKLLRKSRASTHLKRQVAPLLGIIAEILK